MLVYICTSRNETTMSNAINDLFGAIRNIEQRIYAIEARISPENNDNGRQSARDKLHVVLMGPPCSGSPPSYPSACYDTKLLL